MPRTLLATGLLVLAVVPAGAQGASRGVVLPNADAGAAGRIQASGARHVRVFASWRALEPARGSLGPIVDDYSRFVDRMRASGVATYLVVTETPQWAGARSSPPPVGAYADFVGRLAARLRGRVLGYELWNEPDDPHFWAGSASPREYTTLLKAAHAAIKRADPGARVGVGGLTGNNHPFVRGLYHAGARGSFDFVGVHTDTLCNVSDPRRAARDVDGRISRWSFTGYREIRATMLDNGDDKPIWLTEMGWSTTSRGCPTASGPAGVSRARQAAFLTRAYACLAGDPYVELASWFSLSDFGPENAPATRYGLFDHRGRARPALGAFRAAGGVAADRSCGLRPDRQGPTVSLAAPAPGGAISGDLVYDARGGDEQGLRTLTLLVDGRRIRRTAKRRLRGRWTGWRRLPYGRHVVSVRAVDVARNVRTARVVVRRVPYGLGEAIATRIAVGVYGSGERRLVGAQVFTRPRAARTFLRGRLTVAFERRAGAGWVPVGRARSRGARGVVRVRRRFGPGRYRVVVTFPGHRSFRPATARRAFRVH
jgi:Glycosyl hydrolases family 39